MSDLEDISDTDSNDNLPGGLSQDLYCNPPPPAAGPYLEITEQPQSRGFRFRYACEGKSHGGLQGINSRREKKSFPTIKIMRYKGPAKIVVSLVTDEKLPKPHAHELIGKNCSNGVCTVVIKGDSSMSVSFPNLGVRHVTKKSVQKILTERIIEQIKVDKMMNGELGQDSDDIILSDQEQALAGRQALTQAKTMPLSVVRLSFQAYLEDSRGHYTQVLPSIISNPIYDSKAPCASLLKICRMDKVGGCCTGNEEVFLLCDKVQKDDIAVRFYEQDEEGNVKWEEYGNFAPHDVHRQYAIVFRTPSYLSTRIERPMTVHVQLKRFSDNEVSDPKTFTYYPQQTDLEDIQKKRKKLIPNFYEEQNFNRITVTINGSSNAYQNNTANISDAPVHCSRPPIPAFVGNQLEADDIDFCPVSRDIQHAAFSEPSQKSAPMADDTFGGQNLVSRGAGMFELREKDLASAPASIDPARLKNTTVGMLDLSESDSNSVEVSSSASPKGSLGLGGLLSEDDEQNGLMEDSTENITAAVEKALHKTGLALVNAVHGYSSTGDVRQLLHPSRNLIGNQNDDGDNSIHLAVIHEQPAAGYNLLSVLSTLPDEEAVNDRNDLKQTPLYLSVVTKQPQFLDMLLHSGANCWTLDQHGNTLLHLSSRSGNEECLERLLQKWQNNTTFWKPLVDSLNYDGYSALHLAVINNQFGCLKLLLELGKANVNLSDGRSGRTALHHAVDLNNLSFVVHLVLECSADVSLPQFDGNTALHMAVSNDKLDIAAVLIAAAADPDACNLDHDRDEDNDDIDDDDDKVVVQNYAVHHGTVSENQSDKDEDEEYKSKGATPRYYARYNPKMLRILNGESYTSAIELDNIGENIPKSSLSAIRHDVESQLKSAYDSGIDSIKIHSSSGALGKSIGLQANGQASGQAHSGLSISGQKSDLCTLDAMIRARLAKLLDPVRPGSDWRELCCRLDFGPLVDGFQIQKSPTKVMLDNYEELGGTCVELRKALQGMKRGDCVRILEDAVPPKSASASRVDK